MPPAPSKQLSIRNSAIHRAQAPSFNFQSKGIAKQYNKSEKLSQDQMNKRNLNIKKLYF